MMTSGRLRRRYTRTTAKEKITLKPNEALVKTDKLFDQARFLLGAIGVQTHPFLLLSQRLLLWGV